MPAVSYDRGFFEHNLQTASGSAAVVVPLVNEWLAPASVVDLGCGTGSWLAAFRDQGVEEIRGIDGEYVDRDLLRIPVDCFVPHDLKTRYVPTRRYDLALSLEVAEHLPAESGPALVESLVALAPVVLFSAAIPHQGGVDHVHCQWPAFWAELFAGHGYVAVDALRARFWDEPRVAWWYRQNMLLFVAEGALADYPVLEAIRKLAPWPPPSLIHPQLLQWWVDWGMAQSKRYWDLALGKTAAEPQPPRPAD
jgi:SAM-dependent methyltransferase